MGCLNQIREAHQVRLDVHIRVFQRVSNACLRGQMHYRTKFPARKNALNTITIGNVALHKRKPGMLPQDGKPGYFQSFVVEG